MTSHFAITADFFSLVTAVLHLTLLWINGHKTRPCHSVVIGHVSIIRKRNWKAKQNEMQTDKTRGPIQDNALIYWSASHHRLQLVLILLTKHPPQIAWCSVWPFSCLQESVMWCDVSARGSSAAPQASFKGLLVSKQVIYSFVQA